MALSTRDIAPALRRWRLLDGADARLISHSENQIFHVQVPPGQGYALRVHRPGYQPRVAIESELAWLDSVRHDTVVPVPHIVRGRDGQWVQPFQSPAGETRLAVLFRFVDGQEPALADNLVEVFATLGRYAALLHQHALGWVRPIGFDRPNCPAAGLLAGEGPWGDWRLAPGVDDHIRLVLDRLVIVLGQRLAEYGNGPERFGLIHADMRLGNLLVAGEQITLIDFDDCGFGWFTYDFAAALSFHETNPDLPALKQAWLEGYGKVRQLEPADLASLEDMVLLRRMALLAWIGSHAETRLAQTNIHGFANGTVQLAERYLGGSFWHS